MILIRADANETIGTGHIMRCLSIARAFAEKGEEVLFVTADHRADGLIDGFRTECLDTLWTEMAAEIDKMINVIQRNNPDLLLVDSYYVTKKYFNALSGLTSIAYIDDLNQAQWNVDCLINYNVFGTVFDYSWYAREGKKLLLGPRYAPLRKEFAGIKQHFTRNAIHDVFVSAGGADPEGITERIIENICPNWPDVQFHFIVGLLNPRLQEIKKLESGNVVLHINEQHMADLMQKCDIAISAAGSTLYELCACGTPTITYTLADNQLEAAKEFQSQRIMLSAGDCRGDGQFMNRLTECFRYMSENLETREELSLNMQRIVDGLGAKRVINELLSMSR